MAQKADNLSEKVLQEINTAETTTVKDFVKAPSYYPEVQKEIGTESPITRHFNRLSMGIVSIADGILAAGIFYFIHFIKHGSLDLPSALQKLLVIYLAMWLFTAWWAGKFSRQSYQTLQLALRTIFRANGFLLYGITFVVVMFNLTAFSRLYIFGSVLLLAFINAAAYGLWYWLQPEKSRERISFVFAKASEVNLTYFRMFGDAFLLTLAFLIMNYLKRDTMVLHPNYGKALVFAWGLWLISGLMTRKFERRHYPNIYHLFAPYLKSFLLLVFMTSLIGFGLRLTEYSRVQIFGSYGLFIFFEAMAVGIIWLRKKKQAEEGDVETVQQVRAAIQDEPKYTTSISRFEEALYPVTSRLRQVYLKRLPALYEFMAAHIDLDRIDMAESLVLYTHTPYNIEIVEDSSLTLFINLHLVNDFRYMNRYFLTVHRKFYNGGYFVGCAETLGTMREKFRAKYPRILALLFYPFDFLYRRIMPKLPGLKTIYFFLSRGKNRAISKAELLGRLYFCGFRVMAVEEMDYKLYYIAQKIKEPSMDCNPTYGPLIKLQRVGSGGELIEVYKLRTMHPYSEYLQEYMYKHFKLQDNGKFNNDFRLTEWGKVFRTLWIDELPQLINYLRGDLSLVGVRALSPHYFSLYPLDLKKLRIKVKPGLIPPYYADLPEEFEEIGNSERRFLQQKIAHPVRTDWIYFWKVFYNIVFKKARSR